MSDKNEAMRRQRGDDQGSTYDDQAEWRGPGLLVLKVRGAGRFHARGHILVDLGWYLTPTQVSWRGLQLVDAPQELF